MNSCPSIRLYVTQSSQNLTFYLKLVGPKVRKVTEPALSGKIWFSQSLGKTHQICSKTLAKNIVIKCWFKMCLNARYFDYLSISDNRISGKILVFDKWHKKLSDNQITRFFKFKYLKNDLAVWADFLYDILKP